MLEGSHPAAAALPPGPGARFVPRSGPDGAADGALEVPQPDDFDAGDLAVFPEKPLLLAAAAAAAGLAPAPAEPAEPAEPAGLSSCTYGVTTQDSRHTVQVPVGRTFCDSTRHLSCTLQPVTQLL